MIKRRRSSAASRNVRPRLTANQMRSFSRINNRSGRRLVKAQSESGFVDFAVCTCPMNTTGSIALIATIAQGTSTSERVGKKIQYKSIQIRGMATADSTTTSAAGAYLIVYDKRPTGSLPAITDILVTANSNSFNNDANSGRFRILKRVDYAFTGNTATAGQNTAKSAYSVNEYLSLKGLKAEYMAAGTGAIGDISLGALYLVTVGNVAAGTADANLSTGARIRFNDV